MTAAHMTEDQATCPCESCRHYEAVNVLSVSGLTTTGSLGLICWVDQDTTRIDLGVWALGPTGDTAMDAMTKKQVDGNDVESFTPCSLVEEVALARLNQQQGADGLGVTTSAALAAFLEHVEVMNR